MKIESLEKSFQHELDLIARQLDEIFPKFDEPSFGLNQLQSSVAYSVFSPGKRFRPLLSLLTAKAITTTDKALAFVTPFACAVELIHTYSLIHDDLPLMDNDDFRRGYPTNHKVYGEAMALLAGDTLLTEAFNVISRAYLETPQKGLKAIYLLSEASGLRGMVGGQAIDIKALEGHKVSFEELKKLQEMKTGCLIKVAVEGAATLLLEDNKKIGLFSSFGKNLGLAFQLADDILDHDPENLEGSSFTAVIGLDETKKYLQEISSEALKCLEELSIQSSELQALVEFNQSRLI